MVQPFRQELLSEREKVKNLGYERDALVRENEVLHERVADLKSIVSTLQESMGTSSVGRSQASLEQSSVGRLQSSTGQSSAGHWLEVIGGAQARPTHAQVHVESCDASWYVFPSLNLNG